MKMARNLAGVKVKVKQYYWQIQGRGSPRPPTHLFLVQTEARRAEKIFFGDRASPPTPPPPPLSSGLDPALFKTPCGKVNL